MSSAVAYLGFRKGGGEANRDAEGRRRRGSGVGTGVPENCGISFLEMLHFDAFYALLNNI